MRTEPFDHSIPRILLVLAMAASMLVASVGTALAGDRFDDVPNDHTFHDEISWLAENQITTGWEDSNDFHPGRGVTRQAYMAFLHRMAGKPDWADCATSGAPEWTDVSEDHPFCDAINWGTEMGITQGYDDGTFKPGRDVTRQAAAAFQYRGVGEPAHAHATTFDDVPPSHPFYNEISWMDGEGIAEGYPDGRYLPGVDVTRQAAAAFLFRMDQAGFTVNPGSAPAPATNQSYTVTPSDEATNPASSSTTSNEGRRTYEATGLDDSETYNVALFPAENVTVTDGNVTFADETGDGHADGAGTTDANIEVINGSATDRTDDQTASPENGSITFAIDSTTAEQVVPAVWLDADVDADSNAAPDNELDVNDAGEPTEDFGIGGQKNWFNEAQAGPTGTTGDVQADETVSFVNEEENLFETDDGRYFYDADDVFQEIIDGTCQNVSQSTFETDLSEGDVLDASSVYGDNDPDSAGADNSTFCIDDVAPAGPTGVTAEQDAEQPDTVVDVTWNTENVDSQRIYRASDATYTAEQNCADLTIADYTMIDEVAGDAEAYTDEGLEPSTDYCYLVTSVQDDDESTDVIDLATTDRAETATEVVRPTIQDAQIDTDMVLTGAADAGDAWSIVFSEEMDTSVQTNGVFDLQDEDGDVTRVVCDGDPSLTDDGETAATCAFADGTEVNNTDLEIELLEDAEDRNAAGDGVAEYPLTIFDTNGVIDEDNQVEVDLAASADVVIDEEA